MLGIIGKAVGALISPVSKYMTQRNKLKQIKDEGAIKLAQTKVDAQIKQAMSDAENAGELDRITVADAGYKDEYLMFIVTIPLIMAFIPALVPYVEAGFAVLEEMPEYYKYMVAGVFIYVFGYKRIMLKLINAYLNSKIKV